MGVNSSNESQALVSEDAVDGHVVEYDPSNLSVTRASITDLLEKTEGPVVVTVSDSVSYIGEAGENLVSALISLRKINARVVFHVSEGFRSKLKTLRLISHLGVQ